MFSPSLMSMIVHSVLPEARPEGSFERKDDDEGYTTSQDVALALSRLTKKFTATAWPRLPIVGRMIYPIESLREFFHRWFENNVRFDVVGDIAFFWGRVPINLLAEHLLEFRGVTAETHYVDLGTTVRPAGSN